MRLRYLRFGGRRSEKKGGELRGRGLEKKKDNQRLNPGPERVQNRKREGQKGSRPSREARPPNRRAGHHRGPPPPRPTRRKRRRPPRPRRFSSSAPRERRARRKKKPNEARPNIFVLISAGEHTPSRVPRARLLSLRHLFSIRFPACNGIESNLPTLLSLARNCSI